MWSCVDACTQVEQLKDKYPRLKIVEADLTKICLQGSIEIYRSARGFILQREYAVKIIITLDGHTLPKVVDCENAIDSGYPHRYKDGSLCLETDTVIRMRFTDGFDLIAWMDEFVEPYYFSYEFYSRFGVFPFGERPHGIEGMLHAYCEMFCEEDVNKVIRLLIYVAEQKYRGHQLCPCQSGRKVRDCHGSIIFPYMMDTRRKAIVESDLIYIRKVLSHCEHTR